MDGPMTKVNTGPPWWGMVSSFSGQEHLVLPPAGDRAGPGVWLRLVAQHLHLSLLCGQSHGQYHIWQHCWQVGGFGYISMNHSWSPGLGGELPSSCCSWFPPLWVLPSHSHPTTSHLLYLGLEDTFKFCFMLMTFAGQSMGSPSLPSSKSLSSSVSQPGMQACLVHVVTSQGSSELNKELDFDSN